MKHTVILTYQKSTPGTYVFGTSLKGAPVRSQYIAKSAFNGDPEPKMGDEITVTIESGGRNAS